MKEIILKKGERSSVLTDFFRGAALEDKRSIYAVAMKKAKADQQAVIDRARAIRSS